MTMTTNPILALLGRATPAQRDHGADWYPAMRRVCARIARDTGTTTARAASVAAITSPDAQLVTNVRWTYRACTGERPVGRYPARMVPLVDAVLAGTLPPLVAAQGPKVRPFYRAIMGDTDALVLDRWALRLATGSAELTAANRRAAQAVYAEACEASGLPPSTVQAIAWKVARDDMRRAGDTRVKLLDIHEIERDLNGTLRKD